MENRVFMVVTYYIKLFTGADRHYGILMPLLHLAAETIIDDCNYHYYEVS